jgi:hypothetical protein
MFRLPVELRTSGTKVEGSTEYGMMDLALESTGECLDELYRANGRVHDVLVRWLGSSCRRHLDLITPRILRLDFPHVMTQYNATINSPTKLSFCPFDRHDSLEVDQVAVFTV